MLELEQKLYGFNLGVLEKMMEDVNDDEIAAQPIPKMNPPRWILGHLAIANDLVLQMLETEGVCPPDWRAAFAPGSIPNADGLPTPSKSELLGVLRKQFKQFQAASSKVTPQVLAKPHSARLEVLQKVFPTRGELVAQMVSGHLALHLGQLSAWRRATGRAAMF
jgi:hypothetical protein